MMGRKLRTIIPMIPEMLDPEWMDRDDVFLRDQQYKEWYKCSYDQHYNAQPLPKLKPGDSVRIKTVKDKLWLTQGTILEADTKRRLYTVETPRGTYSSDRRHLQKTDRPVHSNYSELVIPSETFVPDADPNPPVTGKELRPQNQNACDIPTVPQSPGVIQTCSGRAIRRPKNLDNYFC